MRSFVAELTAVHVTKAVSRNQASQTKMHLSTLSFKLTQPVAALETHDPIVRPKRHTSFALEDAESLQIWRPLKHAVYTNQADIVSLLLAHGADPGGLHAGVCHAI